MSKSLDIKCDMFQYKFIKMTSIKKLNKIKKAKYSEQTIFTLSK